ncbi:MAG: hypothetical protein U0610_15950 [bacterium]
MSRSRRQYESWSQRTGTIRRGTRPRGRHGIDGQMEEEYGWDPRRATQDRLWVHAGEATEEVADANPTRAVRSFDLLDDDES